MPTYHSPSSSPTRSRSRNRSAAHRFTPTSSRSVSRSPSPSYSRSSSPSPHRSRRQSSGNPLKITDADIPKPESVIKTSLVFLGSIAAATFAAHKLWPKGITYGEKEEWECGCEDTDKARRGLRDEKKRPPPRRPSAPSSSSSSPNGGGGGRRRDRDQRRASYRRKSPGGGSYYIQEEVYRVPPPAPPSPPPAAPPPPRASSRGRPPSRERYEYGDRAGGRGGAVGFRDADASYYPPPPQRYGAAASGPPSRRSSVDRSAGSGWRGYGDDYDLGEPVYVRRDSAPRPRRYSVEMQGGRYGDDGVPYR